MRRDRHYKPSDDHDEEIYDTANISNDVLNVVDSPCMHDLFVIERINRPVNYIGMAMPLLIKRLGRIKECPNFWLLNGKFLSCVLDGVLALVHPKLVLEIGFKQYGGDPSELIFRRLALEALEADFLVDGPLLDLHKLDVVRNRLLRCTVGLPFELGFIVAFLNSVFDGPVLVGFWTAFHEKFVLSANVWAQDRVASLHIFEQMFHPFGLAKIDVLGAVAEAKYAMLSLAGLPVVELMVGSEL